MMTHRHVATVSACVLAVLASARPANAFAFNRPDPVIQAHRDRQAAVTEASQAILARAEAETRDLTAAEQTEIENLANEFDDLERQVGLRERVSNQSAGLGAPRGRQTEAEGGDDDAGEGRARNRAQPARAEPQPRATARGNGGFRHMGDFANAVRAAAVNRGAEPDARLRNAAVSTFGSEGVGADGGFAVPPDFRAEIAAKVFGEDSLIARTDRLSTSSNSITLPIDMTTPWQSTGGIQAYWTGEGAPKTQSKPKLEEVTFKASTLAVLVPVTEELLEDAPAMDGYLRKKAPEVMDFKISDALIRGTGAGMPLGILNSPALVTVPAEGAQAADSIVAANISKMWARMPVASRASSVWLINPDAEPALDTMTVGQTPVYMPAGGLADSPYGRLKGRPVIPHQVTETVGDLGDIMLVDWNQYMSLVKTGGGRDANGLKTDVSIHLWFDQDMVAYRFTIRLGGQPWWSAPTAPRDGSNTMSPFVTLAAR